MLLCYAEAMVLRKIILITVVYASGIIVDRGMHAMSEIENVFGRPNL